MSKLTIGTGIGAAVALLGLALELGDYKNDKLAKGLLIGAGAVFVICLLTTLARGLWRRFRKTIEGWIHHELDQRLAPVLPVGPNPWAKHQARAATADVAALKRALNEVSGELESLSRIITDDSDTYWKNNRLRGDCWDAYGSLIASHDTDIHSAARATYDRIARLNDCIDGQRQWAPDGWFWPEGASIKKCDPELAVEQINITLSKMRSALAKLDA